MNKEEQSYVIIANEILNVLDSTVLSSESKNSILVDYIVLITNQAFEKGQRELITDILDKSTDSNSVLLQNTIKKLGRDTEANE